MVNCIHCGKELSEVENSDDLLLCKNCGLITNSEYIKAHKEKSFFQKRKENLPKFKQLRGILSKSKYNHYLKEKEKDRLIEEQNLMKKFD